MSKYNNKQLWRKLGDGYAYSTLAKVIDLRNKLTEFKRSENLTSKEADEHAEEIAFKNGVPFSYLSGAERDKAHLV